MPLFLAAAMLLLAALDAQTAAGAGTFRGRGESPMGALATATELLNGIGERFDEGTGTTIDASEALLLQRTGRMGAKTSLSAVGSGAREPHYSLFAPQQRALTTSNTASSTSAVSSSSAAAMGEMRFRARAPGDDDSALVEPESDDSASSSSSPSSILASLDQGAFVDVVGSFVLMHQRGRTNRLMASGPALARETGNVRRVIYALLNEYKGGEDETDPASVPIHEIEVRIASPPQPPPVSDSKVDATRERERMARLTFNVALRGLTRAQAAAALDDLDGVDFPERLLARFASTAKTGATEADEEAGGGITLAGHVRLPLTSANFTEVNVSTASAFAAVRAEPPACPFLCTGNGRCETSANLTSGACRCFPGFANEDCSEAPCVGGCGEDESRGTCVEQKRECACHESYFGAHCEHSFCPQDCSAHGLCNNATGKCECLEHWAGEDCGTPVCPEDCAGHGECRGDMPVDGRADMAAGVEPGCECDQGWTGDWCGSPACPLGDNGLQCSGNHLTCANRTCVCRPGFEGEDCSEQKCPNDCSEHGKCVDFACHCNVGWQGVACNYQSCAPGCEAHGTCQNGTCACSPGFEGLACDRLVCPEDCHGRGACVNTPACVAHDDHCHHEHVCRCEEFFFGESCAGIHCPTGGQWDNEDKCSGHGTCNSHKGQCECLEGWWGDACQKQHCPNMCSGHGACNGTNGVCACDPGWRPGLRLDCNWRTCPAGCGGHGACLNGTCRCDHMFSGEGCSVHHCPGWQSAAGQCAGHGTCDLKSGQCDCGSGWTGDGCRVRACPNECRSHGTCTEEGTCACHTGWTGEDCGVRTVVHGILLDDGDDSVQCLPGWGGADCNTRLCAKNCSKNGVCVAGKCACFSGWAGRLCQHPACENECYYHGKCQAGVCSCDVGYHGRDCSQRHVENGVCNLKTGVCTCKLVETPAVPAFAGQMWRGDDCASKSCPVAKGDWGEKDPATGLPKMCSGKRHGTCGANGACACEQSWMGDACEVPACPYACRGRGKCGAGGVCACDDGYGGKGCEIELYKCPKDCSGDHGECVNVGKSDKGPGVWVCKCHALPAHPFSAIAASAGPASQIAASSASLLEQGHEQRVQHKLRANRRNLRRAKAAQVATSATKMSSKIMRRRFASFEGQSWSGKDCAQASCPKGCSDHGDCVDGTCFCDPTRIGAGCEISSCPDSCSNHGQCVLSIAGHVDDKSSAGGVECKCADGWSGLNCARPACPGTNAKKKEVCSGHGECAKAVSFGL